MNDINCQQCGHSIDEHRPYGCMSGYCWCGKKVSDIAIHHIEAARQEIANELIEILYVKKGVPE